MTHDIQTLTARLAQSVGGEAAFASSFSHRTMGDLKLRAGSALNAAAENIDYDLRRIHAALSDAGLWDHRQCDDEEYIAGYIRRWAAWQHADARTANWMVTGPANFPVRTNEKRIATSDRRYAELDEWRKAAPARAVKRARGARKAALGSAGIASAELDDLRDRLAKREGQQAMMKAVNAIIRKHKMTGPDDAGKLVELAAAAGHGDVIVPALARVILEPDCFGIRGFASFSLSNNNAEIKRLRGRVAEVERKLAAAQSDDSPASRTIGEVEIIENVGEDRLQLVFPGKPDDATRAALKSNGFRWSPRNGAWQRHLNNASRYALERVMPLIDGRAAA